MKKNAGLFMDFFVLIYFLLKCYLYNHVMGLLLNENTLKIFHGLNIDKYLKSTVFKMVKNKSGYSGDSGASTIRWICPVLHHC